MDWADPTIANPARGYGVGPDTPILMADGSHRPIAELGAGDEIYGTERCGAYRRYVRTCVLTHQASVKPAYSVTLEDGTELIASADHRFLSARGWRPVAASPHGARQRPPLMAGISLIGTGRFADPPRRSAGYERGYLCGLIRGDRELGSRSDALPAQASSAVAHAFGLALDDAEALERAQRYLVAHDVISTASEVHAGRDDRPAVHTPQPSQRERVDELIRWPVQPSDEWRKGFLAGIFDALGSGRGVIASITNDETIVDWIESCMWRFGLRAVRDGPDEAGATVVRLTGGLRRRLRFFHLVDPAVRRKLDIDGSALKSDARTKVVSIKPLGARLLYDVTTGSGDFIANGIVSHSCLARPTHTELGFDAAAPAPRNADTPAPVRSRPGA